MATLWCQQGVWLCSRHTFVFFLRADRSSSSAQWNLPPHPLWWPIPQDSSSVDTHVFLQIAALNVQLWCVSIIVHWDEANTKSKKHRYNQGAVGWRDSLTAQGRRFAPETRNVFRPLTTHWAWFKRQPTWGLFRPFMTNLHDYFQQDWCPEAHFNSYKTVEQDIRILKVLPPNVYSNCVMPLYKYSQLKGQSVTVLTSYPCTVLSLLYLKRQWWVTVAWRSSACTNLHSCFYPPALSEGC